MREQNGVLEDISAVIGFTATTKMVALFAPGRLLVPVDAAPDHAISLAIGRQAARALSREWGGQVLEICLNSNYHHARKVRAVAHLIKGGMAAKDIAEEVGLNERQVRRLRIEAEGMGLLPLVLRTKNRRGKMSKLTDSLLAAGEQHRGTDLGGLLQWAALHIGGQDEALADVREEHAREEAERLRLENALRDAKASIESALEAVSVLCPPIELGRDFVPHINLMAGHGDPDYLKTNGNGVRHVDCRSAKGRTKVPNVKVSEGENAR